MELVPRAATEQLADAVQDLRVTVVNGPRQAGKTTLLEMFQAAHGGTYRSLDGAEELAAALGDPVAYVDSGERPLIIDEVQRGGERLILAVKRSVDQNRTPGQFVLAGSTRFLTVPTLSESLAGRAAFVDLWPLSMTERTCGGEDFLQTGLGRPAELVGDTSPWTRDDYLELITTGSFPEVIGMRNNSSRRRWFNGYLRTIIERDITEFADIRHAQALPRLAAMIAARAGSPFVASDVGNGLSLPGETIRTYLKYLETVFLTASAPAWSTNLVTRLTKAPKVFLTDSGVAANLTNTDIDTLRRPGHRSLGALTETFVFAELLKLKSLTCDAFEIMHYRDRDGREIDFILETPDGRIYAIEVKASSSPHSDDTRHLTWLRDKLGDRFTAGIVLHLGTKGFSYGDRILSLPLSALWGHAPLRSDIVQQ
ncbi:ATP-binding protein [Nocardia sp. NPDC058666]|uniref:ATP-binding protein n=1 Tax=Nocardia sp. NPDC058666 TaxID=3346587 RepID=UPI003659CCAC